MENEQLIKNHNRKETRSLGIILWILAALSGGMAAYYGIQYWLPNLTASVFGEEQQFFWFLSRATAIVAYLLLWLNMTLGVGITSKLANVWPGRAVSADLHQYLSVLGLGFAAVHALLLMGDQYLKYSLLQILIPFGSTIYRPFWVGVGQFAFYVWGFVFLSFYIKKQIGKRMWRFVHYFSFFTFVGVLTHGILAGSDTGTLLMNGIYWSTGSIFMTAFFYRMITRQSTKQNFSSSKTNQVLSDTK